jgi:hypothetical protein
MPRRWLLMVHQLPSQPSNFRVRAWRQLQQLGAVSIKQAVYVLPDSTSARDEFQRISLEIRDAGGDASVFSAESVEAWSDERLVEAFRHSRERTYRTLGRDLDKALRRLGTRRPRTGTRPPVTQQLLQQFRRRLASTERLDFFAAPGRERVIARLEKLAAAMSTPDRRDDGVPTPDREGQKYRGRMWVTRPRPGVDRMASAWLIRRFIDPDAEFAFATDRRAVPDDAIPFDMSEVELSHQNGRCTFETLSDRFGIRDCAVGRIAAIVHDLDLRDDRFGAPETSTIGAVVHGLQLAHTADEVLLEHGMALFEALYRSPRRATTPVRSQLTRRNTS